MTDIWDEKPEITKTVMEGPYLEYHVVVNPKFESWLEKLRVEYDEYKRKSDILDENLDVTKKLGELMEKAEMTTVAFRTRDAAISRALKAEDKLEAVKAWHKAQLGCQVDPQDIRELGEILEASE